MTDYLMAIDPGPTKSAVILMCDGIIVDHYKRENDDVVNHVRYIADKFEESSIVIEMIASYGRPVGSEVFETCVWIGRFIEAANGFVERVYRRDVTQGLCGNQRGVNDAVVRQRLIDIYSEGHGKSIAIGTKKNPGPLYGITADEWQALAVAVFYMNSTVTSEE